MCVCSEPPNLVGLGCTAGEQGTFALPNAGTLLSRAAEFVGLVVLFDHRPTDRIAAEKYILERCA